MSEAPSSSMEDEGAYLFLRLSETHGGERSRASLTHPFQCGLGVLFSTPKLARFGVVLQGSKPILTLFEIQCILHPVVARVSCLRIAAPTTPFLGSSTVEQAAVNRKVRGSNPLRGARTSVGAQVTNSFVAWVFCSPATALTPSQNRMKLVRLQPTRDP
jgi:hypothetical protein